MNPDCKRCQKKGSGCWQHPDRPGSKAPIAARDLSAAKRAEPCGDPECLTGGDHGEWFRCLKHKTVRDPKTGKKVPCRGNRIQGGTGCFSHGGGAPQVKAAAQKNHRQRLLDMVDPVLGQMARMIEEVERRKLWLHPSAQRLWVTVLDRAGFHPSMKIEADVTTTDQSGWFAYATGAEKKTLLGIMEKCLGRMGGKK